MQISTATMENSVEISLKTGNIIYFKSFDLYTIFPRAKYCV